MTHPTFRRLAVAFTIALAYSILPHAHASTSCPVATGKPYRTPLDTTVYLVTSECTKRPFFNPAVYLSHFSDWSQVVFVEQPVLDAVPEDALRFVPWGPLRTFQNGSLVKLTSDPNVYLLENGKAYILASESAFKAFGYSFDQIEDVTADTLNKFSIQSEPIDDASDAPAGLVFKYSNGPNVYALSLAEGQIVKAYLSSMEEVNAISRGDRIAVLSTDVTFPNNPVDTIKPDSEAPTILSFKTQSPSSTSLTVSIGELIATDNVGVTGYLITESSSTPSISNIQWNASKPSNFAFSSTGTKTMYAWAKDAIGNISNGLSTSVTIVNPSTDIIPPTISSVSSTAIASGIIVSWKTNEASDSVVSYGTTEVYGSTTSSNALVTSHLITITNLTPNTTYHFRISSTDAKGNSVLSGDNIKTLKADMSAPSVTSFSIPASSTSMTVPITAFTATDNVGVAGYILTRTTTLPDPNSPDWTSTPPTEYSFSQSGTVTLYAWVRDASGNMSISRMASTVITAGKTYPKITIASATPWQTSATLVWTTSQPAKCVVKYGPTVQYGSEFTEDTYIAGHTAVLTGLTPGTLYYYYITATNVAGTEQNSGRKELTTLP